MRLRTESCFWPKIALAFSTTYDNHRGFSGKTPAFTHTRVRTPRFWPFFPLCFQYLTRQFLSFPATPDILRPREPAPPGRAVFRYPEFRSSGSPYSSGASSQAAASSAARRAPLFQMARHQSPHHQGPANLNRSLPICGPATKLQGLKPPAW